MFRVGARGAAVPVWSRGRPPQPRARFASGGAPPMISVDTDVKQKMAHLQKVMAEASDGKALKRALSAKLRGLAGPLVAAQRARLLSLPSGGHRGPSMRQAVARQVKATTRWSGREMGVNIKQGTRAMPRNFRMAGRAFNREEGWSPGTLGGETRHQQIRPAQWFDAPTMGKKAEVAQLVREALEEAAATIGSSIHGA